VQHRSQGTTARGAGPHPPPDVIASVVDLRVDLRDDIGHRSSSSSKMPPSSRPRPFVVVVPEPSDDEGGVVVHEDAVPRLRGLDVRTVLSLLLVEFEQFERRFLSERLGCVLRVR
jgi:hypothetical protein